MNTDQITKLLEKIANRVSDVSNREITVQPFVLYDQVITHLDEEEHIFWGDCELEHDGVHVGRLRVILEYHEI